MQPNGSDLMKICENHAKMELCDNSSSEYDGNDHLIVNGNFNTSLGEHCDSIMLLTAHYNGCHLYDHTPYKIQTVNRNINTMFSWMLCQKRVYHVQNDYEQ